MHSDSPFTELFKISLPLKNTHILTGFLRFTSLPFFGLVSGVVTIHKQIESRYEIGVFYIIRRFFDKIFGNISQS